MDYVLISTWFCDGGFLSLFLLFLLSKSLFLSVGQDRGLNRQSGGTEGSTFTSTHCSVGTQLDPLNDSWLHQKSTTWLDYTWLIHMEISICLCSSNHVCNWWFYCAGWKKHIGSVLSVNIVIIFGSLLKAGVSKNWASGSVVAELYVYIYVQAHRCIPNTLFFCLSHLIWIV